MKLRIEKAIYGGAGLARTGDAEGLLAGKTVFAPLTLPGEVVEAHVVEDKRSFMNAELDSVVEPSLLRTTPACPYFGVCGGCSYQHAVYPHQIEMKAAILREALERAHIPGVPTIHTVSGQPWGYRNRIRLHVQSGEFVLGYRERRSHRLQLVDQCPIAAPLLEKAIVTVTEIGKTLGVAGFCDEVEFTTNGDQSSLLLSFFGGKPVPGAAEILSRIFIAAKRKLPQLDGAALFAAEGKQSQRLAAISGEDSLRYRVAGFDYVVGIGSFFQVNRFLIDALVEMVTANRSGRIAWDLYAGVGLFARALTSSFERVIAVESASSSAADLYDNLEGTSHRVIQSSTVDFLRKQKPSSSPPDLVVVDPPRAGLGAEATSLLGAIGAAQVVYVSCDPATLSRDLAALIQSGYDLQTITMVDLFPQTFHLESVSVLTRR